MTYRELYLRARRDLSAAGVDSPGPDALLLAERFLGLDRAGLAIHEAEAPPPDREKAFLRAVGERAERRPLQYILGSWEFLGLRLEVGEGVLVPREDTAVLVEALAEKLKKSPWEEPRGLDLCAGTGAVGLGLCSLLPQVQVTCVELSEQALSYLKRNVSAYPQYRAELWQADVLLPPAPGRFAPGSLEFIASNPPYVRTGELSGLQPEVRREPSLALDGGEDGLTFYRAILAHWAPLLRPGGLLAVEIGEDQGAQVSSLFAAGGLDQIELRQDWAGLDRCVIGTRR